MEPPTCVSLHHKADILVVLGLDANACSAMELQGSQFLSEPRHFFYWRFITRSGGTNWAQLKPILSLLENVSLWELVVLYLILTTKRIQLLTLAHTPASNFLFKTHASFPIDGGGPPG